MTALRTSWRYRSATAAALLAMTVGLAACGGSGGPSTVDTTPIPPVVTTPPVVTPPVVTPPVSMIDQFFAYVAGRVATLLDMDEPLSTDQVGITLPENTEPEPVTL